MEIYFKIRLKTLVLKNEDLNHKNYRRFRFWGKNSSKPHNFHFYRSLTRSHIYTCRNRLRRYYTLARFWRDQ